MSSGPELLLPIWELPQQKSLDPVMNLPLTELGAPSTAGCLLKTRRSEGWFWHVVAWWTAKASTGVLTSSRPSLTLIHWCTDPEKLPVLSKRKVTFKEHFRAISHKAARAESTTLSVFSSSSHFRLYSESSDKFIHGDICRKMTTVFSLKLFHLLILLHVLWLFSNRSQIGRQSHFAKWE